MKKIVLLSIAVASSSLSFAQNGNVGIGTTTPNVDAKLDITATNKGLLLPRIALTGTANAAPLSAHVAGMTIYNTKDTLDVTKGYYYNDGTKWVRVLTAPLVVGEAQARELVKAKNAQDSTKVGYTLYGIKHNLTDTADGIIGDSSITASLIGKGAIDLVTARNVPQVGVQLGNDDAGALGAHSFAVGFNNVAKGENSVVWGMNNEVTGNNSTVGGGGPYFLSGYIEGEPDYSGSKRILNRTVTDSFVYQRGNYVTADNSIVLGSGNNATNGSYQTAIGDNNTLDSTHNVKVFGNHNYVKNYGYGLTMLGTANATNNVGNSTVIGTSNDIKSTAYANIFGYQNYVNTNPTNTIDIYQISIFGNQNNVGKFYIGPVIVGDNNVANDNANTLDREYIFGHNNIFLARPFNSQPATGFNMALGRYITVSPYSDHSIITGIRPTLENSFTNAKSSRIFNIGNGGSTTNTQYYDYPFDVENSDAFTILKNGQVGIGYDNFETRFVNTININTPTRVDINGNLLLGGINTNASADNNDKIVVADSSGVLRTKQANKLAFTNLTVYANDAAADADASLPSGGLYKLAGSGRQVFVKP